MKSWYLFFVIFLCTDFLACSQDNFVLKNIHCFGNVEKDDIKYHFQTPDGSTIALISAENKAGYFSSNYDTAWWLVKFDNELNLEKKVFLSKENDYSSGFDFKINQAGKTILCAIDSFADNISYMNRLVTFDFNLNLLSTISLHEKKNFEVLLNTNKDGGYTVKYNIYDVNFNPDSMAVLIVNADGSLRSKKYITRSQIDTLRYLAYTPTTENSIQDWFTSMTADSGFIYTTSIVYFFETGASQKIGILGITLDTNLNVIKSKLIENKFTEGSGTNRNQLYQLNDTSFLYAYNENLYSMRLYFLNKNYDTILSPFISRENNYYNAILNDKFDFYNFQHPFNIQINDNKVFVPYFHKKDSCSGFSFCSSSTILCFNFNGQLLQKIELDSIPTGLQQEIVYYKILQDLSILIFTENVLGIGVDYTISKFDANGSYLWSYTLPAEKEWKNGLLNNPDFLIEPQIISIAGKERSLSLFRQYKNTYPTEYDTLQLWNFKLNIDNGILLDSTILSTMILNRQTNNLHSWTKIKEISDNNFSAIGTSNIICRNNDVDIFTTQFSKDYNTIVSHVFLDLNSNSVLDSNEHYLSNVSINITKNNTTTESYFDEDGYIVNYTDTGKYEISVNHNYNFFNSAPPSVIKNYTTFGNIDTLRFALQPVATVNDLMVQLTNFGRGRPGFIGSYMLNVLNNGTTIQNATVKLKFPETVDSIITYPTAAIQNDTLSWTFINLEPQQQQAVQLSFHYKAPPANNVGDTLTSTAFVLPISNDTFPDNNISVLYDVLSGSYDPNDKVADKTEYTLDDFRKKEYIKYTIRFENTGNDTAFSIVIIDTLDTNLDISTFTPLNGKYNYTAKITNGNVVTFTFNPIRLPEHTISAISYLIKPKSALANGISIKNRANIKFDYNEPVITNNTQTRITLITGFHNNTVSSKYKLYPNPTKDEITVELTNPEMVNYLQILDILGHIIRNVTINKNNSIVIDVHDLPAGMYILNITHANNVVESVKFYINN